MEDGINSSPEIGYDQINFHIRISAQDELQQ